MAAFSVSWFCTSTRGSDRRKAFPTQRTTQAEKGHRHSSDSYPRPQRLIGLRQFMHTLYRAAAVIVALVSALQIYLSLYLVVYICMYGVGHPSLWLSVLNYSFHEKLDGWFSFCLQCCLYERIDNKIDTESWADATTDGVRQYQDRSYCEEESSLVRLTSS